MSDTGAAERAFEELSDWLAQQLTDAKGTIGETAILEEAVRRYGVARQATGATPYDRAAAFFASDGVGLAQARKPAFRRVLDASEADIQRWTELTEEHAKRMAGGAG